MRLHPHSSRVLTTCVAFLLLWLNGCGQAENRSQDPLAESRLKREKGQQEAAERAKRLIEMHEELRASEPEVFFVVGRLSGKLGSGIEALEAPIHADLVAFAWNNPRAFREIFMAGDLGDYLLGKGNPKDAKPNTKAKVRLPITLSTPYKLDANDPDWLKVKPQAKALYEKHVKGFVERLKANDYNRIVSR